MKGSITPSDAVSAADSPSGRFVLRLDPELHAALRREAAELGLSLNEHCSRVMATQRACADGDAAAVIREIRRRAGGDLVGIVAYGSWARGEPTDTSDVDLLVVLDERLPITRSLYRSWDDTRLRWGARDVDVHLVHPPRPETGISGTWAEAATDGILLFERDLLLSRRLAEIRRRIAGGELVRRTVHGQPYWVHGGDHAE